MKYLKLFSLLIVIMSISFSACKKDKDKDNNNNNDDVACPLILQKDKMGIKTVVIYTQYTVNDVIKIDTSLIYIFDHNQNLLSVNYSSPSYSYTQTWTYNSSNMPIESRMTVDAKNGEESVFEYDNKNYLVKTRRLYFSDQEEGNYTTTIAYINDSIIMETTGTTTQVMQNANVGGENNNVSIAKMKDVFIIKDGHIMFENRYLPESNTNYDYVLKEISNYTWSSTNNIIKTDFSNLSLIISISNQTTDYEYDNKESLNRLISPPMYYGVNNMTGINNRSANNITKSVIFQNGTYYSTTNYTYEYNAEGLPVKRTIIKDYDNDTFITTEYISYEKF